MPHISRLQQLPHRLCFMHQTIAHSELLWPMFFWEPIIHCIVLMLRMCLCEAAAFTVELLFSVWVSACSLNNQLGAMFEQWLKSLAFAPVSSMMWRDLSWCVPAKVKACFCMCDWSATQHDRSPCFKILLTPVQSIFNHWFSHTCKHYFGGVCVCHE